MNFGAKLAKKQLKKVLRKSYVEGLLHVYKFFSIQKDITNRMFTKNMNKIQILWQH